MYDEILVPLDGSKLAESILPYVRCLAEGLRVPVHLLHVRDAKMKTSFSQPLQEEDYLKNIASSKLASLTVRYTIESGKPAEVIVNTAARDASTLIAMATDGRSKIQHWLVGSAANKVLHAARNPLVLMRRDNLRLFPPYRRSRSALERCRGKAPRASESILSSFPLLPGFPQPTCPDRLSL
jgi:nucleotide-binding universal stress UspA family protein